MGRPHIHATRCSFLDVDHQQPSCWRVRLMRFLFLGILLSIVLGAKIYLDLDKWKVPTVYNGSDVTCTEDSFDFPPAASCDTFHDLFLLKRCGALENAGNRLQQQQQQQQRSTNSSPSAEFIKTKCGYVKPVLLTRVQEEDVDIPEVDPGAGSNVPNVVHYVMLGSWEFKFLNYLSFLSVHKFIKPRRVVIHGDQLPHGHWWKKMLEDIPNVYHVFRERPIRIQGWKVPWVEHSSDILRLQTLLDNGGIYLDTDVLVLKSFNPLLQYELTLGRESVYGLGNSIILSAPGSSFVCMWLSVYSQYAPYPWNWAAYSIWAPNKLATLLPDSIHIEHDSLQKPSWSEAGLLFDHFYDWSNNYAVHVWKRYAKHPLPDGPRDIVHLNNTLGEIMRFIYLDSSKDVHLQNDTKRP